MSEKSLIDRLRVPEDLVEIIYFPIKFVPTRFQYTTLKIYQLIILKQRNHFSN